MRKERLPFAMKPIVPEAALDLLDELADAQFPQEVECPTGGHHLELQGKNIMWSIDKKGHKFLLGPLPTYPDKDCGVIYIPTGVLKKARAAINSELPSIGRRTFRLPKDIQPLKI